MGAISVVQNDRRRIDYNTELLNEAKRAVRDAWKHLRRLRASNEASMLVIRQSQDMIAEMTGGGNNGGNNQSAPPNLAS
jgi:predicted metal-dependent hydrolase